MRKRNFFHLERSNFKREYEVLICLLDAPALLRIYDSLNKADGRKMDDRFIRAEIYRVYIIMVHSVFLMS